MAMDADGRFLGLRIALTANLGAYISQYGPFIPFIGVTMTTGVYDIQAIDVSTVGVYTNTCPVDAYRGAGRPEAFAHTQATVGRTYG
jgi:carbon-monoxide dehydrogenase large subunit